MAASEQGSADYEWEFIEPPASELDCEMCHKVLQEPFLTTCCGSHFCQACIDPVVKEGKPCPSCEEELTVFIDKKTKRKIFSLDVRCPMWRRGCKWVGELGGRSDHLDEKNGDCRFVDVSCSNACGGRVQRRELPTHLEQACPKRAYVCDYCPFEATFDVVTTQHWQVCGYFPLPCPNKCDVGRVERQNLKQHLKECSLQEVECDFSYAGCQVKLQRKDFASHMEENTQNHMRMTQGKLKDVAAGIEEEFRRDLQGTENQIAELQRANKDQKEQFGKEIAQLQERVKEVQDQKNRQIAEVQEALKQKDQQLAGIAAQMQEKDEQITQLLMTQGKLKDVAAGIKEEFRRDLQATENQIAELQGANTDPEENFELEIVQLQLVNADLQERVKEVQDQKNRQIAEVQEALKQKDQQLAGIAAQVREKDEQITQLVTALNERVEGLERRAPLVEFTMPDFSSYKKQPPKWWVDAPCFYTHNGGYRMQVRTIANSGVGKGVMSVYVYVAKGDFDDQLKWPLKATVTLQLIDPTGEHGPYERSNQGTVGRGGKSIGRTDIPHTDLEKYIHNDSLHFRVVSVKVE